LCSSSPFTIYGKTTRIFLVGMSRIFFLADENAIGALPFSLVVQVWLERLVVWRSVLRSPVWQIHCA